MSAVCLVLVHVGGRPRSGGDVLESVAPKFEPHPVVAVQGRTEREAVEAALEAARGRGAFLAAEREEVVVARARELLGPGADVRAESLRRVSNGPEAVSVVGQPGERETVSEPVKAVEPVARLEPGSLVIQRRDDWLSVTGSVASEAERRAIEDAVGMAGGDLNLGFGLDWDEGIEPAPWAEHFGAWWAEVDRQVIRPELRVEGRRMRLSGEALSGASREAVRAVVRDAFGEGWTLDLEPLQAREGEPPRLVVKREGRWFVIEGEVSDYVERARVEATVRTLAPDVAIRNRLSVDENVLSPEWLMGFADWYPAIARHLEAPALEVSGAGVRIAGRERMPGGRMAVDGMLRAVFEHGCDLSGIEPCATGDQTRNQESP